jgi:HSP20 family protein
MATTQIDVKKTAPASASAVEPWHSFRDEMDRLFDRFSTGFGMPGLGLGLGSVFGRAGALAAPAVDIAEDDKGYTISAELPGTEEKDIDVSVSGAALTIKGEKKQQHEQKDKNYYLSERSYGSFRRVFSLPEGVDPTKITASFAKGVLTVTLPKDGQANKSQKIEIKAA